MRIVIDLQGAQTASRFRGIGRYSMDFVTEVARQAGQDEVIIALNGRFPETIDPIRSALFGLLPQENIRIWESPGEIASMTKGVNSPERNLTATISEAFLASLAPDLVHVTSAFEGYAESAFTAHNFKNASWLKTATLYDLIPLIHAESYLTPNPPYAAFYRHHLALLEHYDSLLCISESSKQEAIQHLGAKRIVNVSCALHSNFNTTLSADKDANTLKRLGLTKPYILYVGAADPRKNLDLLISAYSRIATNLRETHQLACVGLSSEGDYALVRELAKSRGLSEREITLHGYLPDAELIMTYQSCRAFVFPSLHEGFGLPPLEAMACGAPVLAANRTSLPEVVGNPEALFDPDDQPALVRLMERTLQDPSFRSHLAETGRKRHKLFSWQNTASRAWHEWRDLYRSRKTSAPAILGGKPKLAFVSPLPPARTGIADFCAELLPAMQESYRITLVDTNVEICASLQTRFGKVKDPAWLQAHARSVDRVIYHFGNSTFHSYMFDLLKAVPGVVVLHDLFLGTLIAHEEQTTGDTGRWMRSLFESHGYTASAQLAHSRDWAIEMRQFACSGSVIRDALHIIVHSQHSLDLLRRSFGDAVESKVSVIPLARAIEDRADREEARKNLGLDEQDFLVCSFGFLGPIKQNKRLLSSWLNSTLADNPHCHLVFVGENDPGCYGRELVDVLKDQNHSRISITGYTSREQFRSYLTACDLAVQLRTDSRGETSAAVLDAMGAGLPLIVNAHGSMAELDQRAVRMLADDYSNEDLTHALESLFADPEARGKLGAHAREVVKRSHSPEYCASRYQDVIEMAYDGRREGLQPSMLARVVSAAPDSISHTEVATSLARTFPPHAAKRQLLLDVSETCRTGLHTGIQRVARALLLAFLEFEDMRVEPVALHNENGIWSYNYARSYTSKLLGIAEGQLPDMPMEAHPGDVLLSLDLSVGMLIGAGEQGLLRDLQNRGVSVAHVVFDLLPVTMPHVFPPGADAPHAAWLRTVARGDAAYCISKAVADDFRAWIQRENLHSGRRLPFDLGWFHLSPDIGASAPTKGLPPNADAILSAIRARPSVLMVGTIEPRKGYLETIHAFTQLWNQESDLNLVIVGRRGWNGLPEDQQRDIPETVRLLQQHPQRDNHLFWIDGASDEFLGRIYSASRGLLAASYGEGFGLPLIEAAEHGLPVLARDLPVFREIAGGNVSFFESSSPGELASAVNDWSNRGFSPASSTTSTAHIDLASWKDAAARILTQLQQHSSQTRKSTAP